MSTLFTGLSNSAPNPPATARADAPDPFIALEQAIAALAENASPGLSVISAMKGAWAKTRNGRKRTTRQILLTS